MTFLLKRVSSGGNGTFGVLINEQNIPILTTLERPWLNNQQNISCIPAGTYECKRVVKPEHGECFELQNVPGRGSILIHAGNTIKDSKGCILLGMEYGSVVIDGKDVSGVLLSKGAIDTFMRAMKGNNSFTLRVIDATI